MEVVRLGSTMYRYLYKDIDGTERSLERLGRDTNTFLIISRL